MIKPIAVAVVLLSVSSISLVAQAQPSLVPGDVLVTTFRQTGAQSAVSRILIYSSDGIAKGELASIGYPDFRETLFRDGRVFVATGTGIQTISAAGGVVMFSEFRNPVWLAPALDGSIVASNGSGELYHIEPDGSIRRHRDTVILNDPRAKGIELDDTQCTAHYLAGGALVLWDLCVNSNPAVVGPAVGVTETALRLLPDGTYLAAHRSDVSRLDATGTPIRQYQIPSHGLALDVDGRSFWAGAGGTLLKIDIETGAILLSVLVSATDGIEYLSVVGEPRASLTAPMNGSIPTLGWESLIFLVVALAVIAFRAVR